jgi:hypothetical protein
MDSPKAIELEYRGGDHMRDGYVLDVLYVHNTYGEKKLRVTNVYYSRLLGVCISQHHG